MRRTELVMGMPVEVAVSAADAERAIDEAFAYFREVDERFSTYKEESEIARLNRGEISLAAASPEMREVYALAEKTKGETDGYFDMRRPDGLIDPSGIVKGWAIKEAARRIASHGHEHFFVNAGGDIASSGKNEEGKDWSVGIRNPFNADEIVKVIYPKGKGVATSGSYVRGAHIYDPHDPENPLDDIVSITVVGPDVLEADRIATAAFAMGEKGSAFVETLPGFEAYAIDTDGVATFTSGFSSYALA